MARIEKKSWPPQFKKVLSGKRTELRLGDWEAKSGDTLYLREWDPKTKKYTGRSVEKKVVSSLKLTPQDLRKFWTQADIERYGFQIIEIE